MFFTHFVYKYIFSCFSHTLFTNIYSSVFHTLYLQMYILVFFTHFIYNCIFSCFFKHFVYKYILTGSFLIKLNGYRINSLKSTFQGFHSNLRILTNIHQASSLNIHTYLHTYTLSHTHIYIYTVKCKPVGLQPSPPDFR